MAHLGTRIFKWAEGDVINLPAPNCFRNESCHRVLLNSVLIRNFHWALYVTNVTIFQAFLSIWLVLISEPNFPRARPGTPFHTWANFTRTGELFLAQAGSVEQLDRPKLVILANRAQSVLRPMASPFLEIRALMVSSFTVTVKMGYLLR